MYIFLPVRPANCLDKRVRAVYNQPVNRAKAEKEAYAMIRMMMRMSMRVSFLPRVLCCA